MKIEYSTLLDLIPREPDRNELTRLTKEYYETGQGSEDADPTERATTDTRQSELLDQILEKIQWHFRAMRRPMPTREEVAEMVTHRSLILETCSKIWKFSLQRENDVEV